MKQYIPFIKELFEAMKQLPEDKPPVDDTKELEEFFFPERRYDEGHKFDE